MAVLVFLDPHIGNHFPFDYIFRIGNGFLLYGQTAAQLHRAVPQCAGHCQFIIPKGRGGRLKAGTDLDGRIHANADGNGKPLSQLLSPIRHGADMSRSRSKEDG